MRVITFFALLLVSTSSLDAFAENARACSTPQYRAFDFWIGDWQVHTPDGKLVGYNRITREHGSCVIHEHYTTARGYSGESLNIFDASRKVWHQTWVDSDGTLLVLEGQFQGNSMQLSGQLIDDKGKPSKQRITWTPNADGSVRQLWEAIDEKGVSSTVFDGKYIRHTKK